jgi:hypothetical protein
MDLKSLLYHDKMHEMEEDVPLFGIIDDGLVIQDPYERLRNDNEAWHNL